jgi:hypothetical protein
LIADDWPPVFGGLSFFLAGLIATTLAKIVAKIGFY